MSSGLPLSSETTADSLAVLEALLKLTKKNNENSMNGSSLSSSSLGLGRPSIANPLFSPTSNGSISNAYNDALNSLLQSSSMMRTNFPSSYGSPFSSSANASAAAATLLASSGLSLHPNLIGSATAASTTTGLDMYAASQPQSIASQLAAAAVSFAPSIPPALTQQQQKQRMQQALPAASAAATPSSRSSKTNSTASSVTQSATASPPPPPARRITSRHSSKESDPLDEGKVRAALHSAPQRGKRRDDLSDKERMELTRTRNREHAKSTRLRKKARYQELLDSEDQLKELQHAESLRQGRLATIRKFLLLREAMLNHDDAAAAPSSSSSAAKEELQELVDHLASFQFEVHGPKSTVSSHDYGGCSSNSIRGPVALLRMLQWDQDIRHQCHDDADRSSSFQFEFADGIDGIALSKNGSGFARVDLLSKRENDPALADKIPRTVLSGILSIQFASASSRLSSVSWTTLTSLSYLSSVSTFESSRQEGSQAAEVAAAPPQQEGDEPSSASSSNETLEHQMMHPSVVSLDLKAFQHHQTADATTESSSNNNGGPGMDI